ncbi:MAG: DUF4184 family protein [Chloroflexi bacterium]|nr:DUF4184 family protein [Chloroflexota bacterium]
MPFTFSHPAASVPLARRRGLVLSALIVGSMAPDFEYLFRLSPESHFSHTPAGVFLFCVPVGLAALWVFHTVLKYPVLSLLPNSHQSRLIPVAKDFSFGPFRRFSLIMVSLVLGTFTHVAWDSFTHAYGWMVQQFPVLSWSIIETSGGSVRIYKVLQHGSTLVGAVLLCYWYMRWFRQAPAEPMTLPVRLSAKTRLNLTLALGSGAFFLGGVYGYLSVPAPSDFQFFRLFVGRTVVASISVLLVELIVFSLFWHLTKTRARAHSEDQPISGVS